MAEQLVRKPEICPRCLRPTGRFMQDVGDHPQQCNNCDTHSDEDAVAADEYGPGSCDGCGSSRFMVDFEITVEVRAPNDVLTIPNHVVMESYAENQPTAPYIRCAHCGDRYYPDGVYYETTTTDDPTTDTTVIGNQELEYMRIDEQTRAIPIQPNTGFATFFIDDEHRE
jgi:hypothetical protein